MSTIYIKDHYIKPEGQWTGKEMKDWLHPCHGPLPYKLGAVRHEGEEYMVALWATTNGVITVTELINLSHIQDNWDTMAKKKGWIAHSLYWKAVQTCFVCKNYSIPIQFKKVEGRKILLPKTEEDMYRLIMIYSVIITAETPIGGTVTTLKG